MATNSEFLEAYERIKTTDELVTSYFTTAIDHEEREHPMEAIAAYESAGQCIEEVFKLPVGLPDDSESVETQWLDACAIIKKLKAAKETIGERLRVLRHQNDLLIDQEAQEATEMEEIVVVATALQNGEEPASKKRSVLCENPDVSNDVKDAIESYRKYVTAIREVLSSQEVANDAQMDEVSFDKIFQAPVKLYKITQNGHVETIVGESIMTLVMCNAQEHSKWNFLNGVSFIQCMLPIAATMTESSSSTTSSATPPTDAQNLSWIYPLLPAVTTCYRTEYRAFIFPDLESANAEMHSTAFGIMLSNDAAELSEEAFADYQQFFLDLLEAILAGEIVQLAPQLALSAEDERIRETRDVSESISRGIINGADFIARTLVRGAEKTGELLDLGTPYLMSKMSSAPTTARPVSNTVQRTVGAAKVVTGAAAGATGWVAGKIGAAAQSVGAFLAPHVEAQGANLLERGFGYQKDDAHSKMKGALTLAAGTVEGITTVYSGLEQSADVLGKSLSNNSVKIISHKYGSSAGDVAADTFDTIGNTWHVSKNLKIIKPKGLAENLFKKTGTGVVGDYKGSLRGKKNIVPAGELLPDLCDLKKKDTLG